ncbi:uncharacterized protein MEPE_01524 [Melanopsichium pennsylvanicum]|uniref:CFA20 domain-containing protein n=1 Tax=Melanopsichium pennsylvanicum TaxID=63383 RepID=A0AAJ4XIM6_9BASI|nr:uncharacterized protein MEPE_01524 [Melanopsichium pennsylvanicum]
MSDENEPLSLFGHVVQPGALSLFSSTSSEPFGLWALHQDPELEEDSGIRLLVDTTNVTAPTDPGTANAAFKLRMEQASKGSSSDTVLHIQSPSIRKTFIRSPPDTELELGIKHAYITFQFRSIGRFRPFLFEIGIKDMKGRAGVIRASSFQSEPKLHLQPTKAKHSTKSNEKLLPTLHLPLTIAAGPKHEETSLTEWQVLTLPLSQIARHLSDTSIAKSTDVEALSKQERFASFHSISYVKIHANLRLRRVWCSEHLPDHDLAEFQVFS